MSGPTGTMGTDSMRGNRMPDERLIQQTYDVVERLSAESDSGELDGEDIAAHLDADDISVRHAFKHLKDRGQIHCYFPGGMGLPKLVRLT